jgi:hypothetical protein
VRTAVVVKIMGVDGTNDTLAPVGTVDAMPLVKQMDGAGKCFSHGTIFSLSYVRMQGGTNAIICDPKVGDLGLAVICDRDISSVKANKGEANPGSRRKFSLSDGVYIGGMLNGMPEQYVFFTPTGMKLADKNGNVIEMKVGSIDVTTAAFRVNGAIIAGFGTADQVGLQTHIHAQGTDSHGDTEVPTNLPTAGT